jgi:hypothetical protein
MLGTGEHPPGSNCTKYGAAFGIKCAAWCAMGLWYLYDRILRWLAGLRNVKTAWTPTLAQAFYHAGAWSDDPELGLIPFYAWYGPNYQGRWRGVCHVGLAVEGIEADGKYIAIEANVGNKVTRIRRSMAYVVGFGVPDFLYEPAKANRYVRLGAYKGGTAAEDLEAKEWLARFTNRIEELRGEEFAPAKVNRRLRTIDGQKWWLYYLGPFGSTVPNTIKDQALLAGVHPTKAGIALTMTGTKK